MPTRRTVRRAKQDLRSKPAAHRARGQRWSKRVMQTSDALDLEKGAFTHRSARRIAQSLKRSADRSRRRKSDPFRSAMSMLNFYINRAGSKLPKERKRTLERAKAELRALYGKPVAGRVGGPRA